MREILFDHPEDYQGNRNQGHLPRLKEICREEKVQMMTTGINTGCVYVFVCVHPHAPTHKHTHPLIKILL